MTIELVIPQIPRTIFDQSLYVVTKSVGEDIQFVTRNGKMTGDITRADIGYSKTWFSPSGKPRDDLSHIQLTISEGIALPLMNTPMERRELILIARPTRDVERRENSQVVVQCEGTNRGRYNFSTFNLWQAAILPQSYEEQIGIIVNEMMSPTSAARQVFKKAQTFFVGTRHIVITPPGSKPIVGQENAPQQVKAMAESMPVPPHIVNQMPLGAGPLVYS